MKSFLLAVVFGLMSFVAMAQYPLDHKRDWHWRFGYDYSPPNWGLSKIDFSSGSPVCTFDSLPFSIGNVAASISDQAGQLAFYTNGPFVANRFEETTPNGDSIGCCTILFNQEVIFGCDAPQNNLILPHPGNPEWYVYYRQPLELGVTVTTGFYAPSLQYNLLDGTADSGKGDVVEKNIVLYSDTLDANGVSACRHANGRDWWIVERYLAKARFFTFMLSPQGTHLVDTQELDIFFPQVLGQSFFTPDGSKLIYSAINNWTADSAYVYTFDFNRCTGQLSNPQRVVFTAPNGSMSQGGAVSPNSRFLYVNFPDRIFQFDLQASDLMASQTQVALYDGFVDTVGGTATGFTWMQLGPDNKIYITAGASTYLHVIENPDEQGIACNVNQHGFKLSALNGYSIPNFPNFRLGPIDGSACDTLGIDVITATSKTSSDDFDFTLSPNPFVNQLSITAKVSTKSFIEIRNAIGQKVYSKQLDSTTGIHHNVDLSFLSSGVYTVSLSSNNNRVTRKAVKL